MAEKTMNEKEKKLHEQIDWLSKEVSRLAAENTALKQHNPAYYDREKLLQENVYLKSIIGAISQLTDRTMGRK